MVVHAIHSIGRARGLGTVIGGGEVVPMPRRLSNRLGQRSVKGGPCPVSEPPQALSELGFGRSVIDRPGSIKNLAAQGAAAALGEFEDGVQEAKDQGEPRKELAPRVPRRRKPVRAHRARRVRRGRPQWLRS